MTLVDEIHVNFPRTFRWSIGNELLVVVFLFCLFIRLRIDIIFYSNVLSFYRCSPCSNRSRRCESHSCNKVKNLCKCCWQMQIIRTDTQSARGFSHVMTATLTNCHCSRSLMPMCMRNLHITSGALNLLNNANLTNFKWLFTMA